MSDVIQNIKAVCERNRQDYQELAKMTGQTIAQIEADTTAPDLQEEKVNQELEQRIGKLPQWAQRYISKLQRDNAALCAERGKIADGNAKIKFWVNFDEDHGIPDRAKVVFQADGGTIELALRDGKVQVHASYVLIIEPASSNVVNLSVQR